MTPAPENPGSWTSAAQLAAAREQLVGRVRGDGCRYGGPDGVDAADVGLLTTMASARASNGAAKPLKVR